MRTRKKTSLLTANAELFAQILLLFSQQINEEDSLQRAASELHSLRNAHFLVESFAAVAVKLRSLEKFAAVAARTAALSCIADLQHRKLRLLIQQNLDRLDQLKQMRKNLTNS